MYRVDIIIDMFRLAPDHQCPRQSEGQGGDGDPARPGLAPAQQGITAEAGLQPAPGRSRVPGLGAVLCRPQISQSV